ncbi:MAG TPA: bifunctional UDP-sugar hydrolase/5'-nucleotidase [bacterium]|nr:bifunctional UDP-sugar hydrolase/5'-nucleotidase [bacterium]
MSIHISIRYKIIAATIAFAIVFTGLCETWNRAEAAEAAQVQPARAALVTITHTNDLHGTARGSDFASTAGLRPEQGILRAASIIRSVRAENPNTLALDAGDLLHGTPLVYSFKGEPMIELLNTVGYDAMTLGNHDFEWGMAALEKHAANADFAFLAANALFPAERDFSNVKPYIIREFEGARIAVVGLATQQTEDYIWPPYLEGTRITPPADALAALMPEIKEKSDFVIVLSHLGFEQDMLLAQNATGINMILGGHTHKRVYPPAKVGATEVFNSGSRGEAVGIIELLFSFDEKDKIVDVKTSNRLVETSLDIPEAKDLAAIYGAYLEEFKKKTELKIATSLIDLDASDVRQKENRLGRRIADAIRNAAGTQIAVIDTTLIGAGIPEGDISLIDLHAVLPAYTRQNVVSGKLSGAKLRDALEHSVSGFRHPMLLQVSGLEFALNAAAPAGSRVSDILIDGVPLDGASFYSVASTSHLFMGGTGFNSFLTAIDITDLGKTLREVVAEDLADEYYIWPEFKGAVKMIP